MLSHDSKEDIFSYSSCVGAESSGIKSNTVNDSGSVDKVVLRTGSKEETNCRLRIESMHYDDDGVVFACPSGLSPQASNPASVNRQEGLIKGRANSLVGTIGSYL